jgi:hypothetical protein
MKQTPKEARLFTRADEVDPLFWDRLAGLNPGKVALRGGAALEEGVFRLELLGREFRVDPSSRRIEGPGGREADFQEALVLLAYLGGETAPGISGDRVPLRSLPGGELFFAKTHTPATDDLPAKVDLDPGTFLRAGEEMGGRDTGQGDASWLMMALPQIPLEAFFFSGDEEFSFRVTVLIDRAAADYFSLDVVYALVNLLARRIKRLAKGYAGG